MVLTDIEPRQHWGKLRAPQPRHINFLRRALTVEETIVEISRKDSPTGERMVFKPYPKDDEPRTLRISQDLLDTLAARPAALPSPAPPSTAATGAPPSTRRTSTSRSGCTTFDTPTPRCYRPAALTSWRSWSAWGTRRS
jgi:hypothetical protein